MTSVGDVQKRVKLYKHNMHELSFRKAEFGARERDAKQLYIRMQLQNDHYHAME